MVKGGIKEVVWMRCGEGRDEGGMVNKGGVMKEGMKEVW